MKSMTLSWNKDQEHELARLLILGHSRAEIAAKIKRTRSAVCGKSWRMKKEKEYYMKYRGCKEIPLPIKDWCSNYAY